MGLLGSIMTRWNLRNTIGNYVGFYRYINPPQLSSTLELLLRLLKAAALPSSSDSEGVRS